MAKSTRSLLFQDFEGNPILSPEGWPYPANAIFNPGATEINGQVLLLCRVEDYKGFSHLTVAKSKDGITNWKVDNKPTLKPDPNFREEEWGVEDPRISYLKDRKEYAVTYTSFSQGGPLVSLILTKDFETFSRFGRLLPPEDKDAALFPTTFKNRYALIHRPIIRGEAHIWISFSPDLKYWGEHQILLPVRAGWWDCHRVGIGPPPIETEEGWLIIYHGARFAATGIFYRVGLALLDLEEPTKVIKRSTDWVLGPTKSDNIPGIVFPTGTILRDDKIYLYYGINDSDVGLSFSNKRDLVKYLFEENEKL